MTTTMTKRMYTILAFMLLLIPTGIVVAQSSADFSALRVVILGGGVASSASFSVTGVIGQPVTARADSPSFKVSGGFLHPLGASSGELWLPTIHK